MTTGLLSACVFLGLSILVLTFAVIRRAERWEFVAALFFGEWGIAHLALERAHGQDGMLIFAVLMFGAMVATAVMWRSSFKEWQRRAKAQH
jgi:hypothetical protein